MRQKNQIELNSGTGAEGEAQSAAVREIEGKRGEGQSRTPGARQRGDRIALSFRCTA
jgi:hypothetical protein